MSEPAVVGSRVATLLDGFSLEMTAKDADAIQDTAPLLPAGTHVNITYLGNESTRMREAAASAARSAGLVPVPHIAARRLASRVELDEFLAALRSDGDIDTLFVVAGDPPQATGPFTDALDVIDSGIVETFGISCIGIGGYPEGHPLIDEATLWTALGRKAASIREHGVRGEITTQFGFDVEAQLRWIERVRDSGVDLPVRVGVPGPAGVKRLVAYARRFGVRASSGIAKKYGFSITNLIGTAGPDRFITEFAEGYDPARHGDAALHFYTFGGLRATADWVRAFQGKASQ